MAASSLRKCGAEAVEFEWCHGTTRSLLRKKGFSMRVVIGSDHAGWPLKTAVVEHVRSLGHEVIDVGAFDDKPVDFPDVARALTQKVKSGEAERGIMVCGTGVGASIAANKVKG